MRNLTISSIVECWLQINGHVTYPLIRIVLQLQQAQSIESPLPSEVSLLYFLASQFDRLILISDAELACTPCHTC